MPSLAQDGGSDSEGSRGGLRPEICLVQTGPGLGYMDFDCFTENLRKAAILESWA